MFNLQANAYDISKGIREDLDMEIYKIGISITGFNIQSFSYPPEIEAMQKKAASQQMVGDMNRYQQMAVLEAMGKPGNTAGSNMATQMAGMQMGMMMGQQMVNQMQGAMNMNQNQMNQAAAQPQQTAGTAPKFCPNCGTPTNGANFCSNCGNKLV